MANYDSQPLVDGYVFRLTVDVVSQNYAGNTSLVAWAAWLLKGSGTGKYSGWTNSVSVTIGGNTYPNTNAGYDFTEYTQLKLIEGTTTVAHAADGTLDLLIAAAFTDHPNGWFGSAQIGPGWHPVPTIPRASTPSFSASAVDAGEPITIDTNRASSGFTHTVKYAFGSQSGTIATGVGTSVSWTPPLSLLSEIPSATSGTCTITLETYSGGTLIGSRSANFTLRAGSGVVPDFTTISHAEAVAAVASQIGGYVQGQSKLTLGISGEAGAYGSAITGYQLTVAGQTINAKTGTTPNVINASGTVTVTGTVTDSRGRTRTKTITVTVLVWAVPTITSMAARRALVDGIPDEDGTSIRVDLQAAVSSLVVSTQKNALTYRVYTRMRGDTGAWTLAATATPAGITFSSSIVVSGYPVDTSYDVRVEVSDRFTTSAIVTVVATAEVLMHWADAGIGVGKFWEQGALDVDGDIYMSGTRVSIEGHSHTGAEVAAATTSARGSIELATQAEVDAGTDGARALTPATARNATYRPYAEAAGVVTLPALSHGQSTTIAVTFPTGRFAVAPRVALASGRVRVNVAAVDKTGTGFTIEVGNWSGDAAGASTVEWIAVQMTSAAASG